MKAAFQFFKKYPISIICYLVFTWICYKVLGMRVRFHEMIKQGHGGISSGEGFVYAEAGFIMISGIFFLLILINAIVRKNVVVYLLLCFIIVIQALITLNAG
jgi:hypothetical protein